MNLPNFLTLSRLAGIPVLMALMLIRFPGHDQLAAAGFVLFSLTDTLDGQLARRSAKVTELGKFLDPLADKLFILSVLIALVQEGLLAAWIVIVIFGREMLITILRSLSASQGRVIAATPFGKTKTVTQTGAVLLLLLQRPYPILTLPAQVGIAIAVVFTVASGLDYLWRFRHVFTRTSITGAAMPSPTGGAPGAESQVDPLVRELAEKLKGTRLQVATAESCTGGLVSSLITDRSGSSSNFVGGVVSYSKELKKSLLGVPAETLERFGAISPQVAHAMAEGARDRLHADVAVSVTGVAGPEPDEGKPPGLTYIGVASRDAQTDVREFRFDGDRSQNRHLAAQEALRMLIERVAVLTGAH